MECMIIVCLCLAIALLDCSHAEKPLVPVIVGDWWQVADSPDIGDISAPNQQPVDFAVWQAVDGTWQLWSCIRGTKCGGNTRLLYRWESKNITDADWEPKGIAMEADPSVGETLGGLQAPHVVKWEGRYIMAYGSWTHICFATSDDGKTFTREIGPNGKTGVFTECLDTNTRDAMLLYTKGLWHCYYTDHPGNKGYNFCRTSPDLKTWSDSFVVAYGGQSGTGPCSAECPQVVEPEDGYYTLFRTQFYGKNAKTSVYGSTNPRNFGIDDDTYLLCTLPIAAPEVVYHERQYYIAALKPDLNGIQIARLEWKTEPKQSQA